MPARSNIGCSSASDSTVDSIPTVVGPPSRIMSAPSPSAFSTCSAVVGDSSVKRFALGAAIGTPAATSSASATGCAGMRTPTVSSPAVTTSGTDALLRQHQRQRPRPVALRQALRRVRPFRDQAPRHLDGSARARSAGLCAAGPWPRRSSPPPPHPAHSRPARTPSRSETPPAFPPG